MSPRPGFALLYAMFMIMALSVVGLGLMATATRETTVATAVERQLRARARAEAGALHAIGRWSTRTRSEYDLDPSLDLPLPSAIPGAAVTVTRLDSTLYLLRAEAVDPLDASLPGRTTARAALLVRTLSPSALAAAFPAAITATVSVDIDGGAVRGAGPCGGGGGGASTEGSGPGVLAPDVVVGSTAAVDGEPPVARSPAPPPPAPDPFAAPLAGAIATAVPERSVITPAPSSVGGECLPETGNWGSVDPLHVCHALLPFIHHTGQLTAMGGEGRGILVVDGDAHLTGGIDFHGLIVVRGRLLLDGGASVRGAIRARSVIARDADVERNDCVASAALQAPALDRAFRAPDRWWVPVF